MGGGSRCERRQSAPSAPPRALGREAAGCGQTRPCPRQVVPSPKHQTADSHTARALKKLFLLLEPHCFLVCDVETIGSHPQASEDPAAGH